MKNGYIFEIVYQVGLTDQARAINTENSKCSKTGLRFENADRMLANP